MYNQSDSLASGQHLQVMSPNEGMNALVLASSGQADGLAMQVDGGPPDTPSPLALAPPVTNNTLIQVGQLQVSRENALVPTSAQGDLQLIPASGDRVQEPALIQIQRIWEENCISRAQNHDYRLRAEACVRDLEHNEVNRVARSIC